ncbi:MAG: HAD family hydrolase [Lachnospiraceae bacterium]|nr:HAD family hydrolase [Lachnospiraceae bacterium]
MKTLYVSDLDGTLLRSNERTSDFTNRTINELVEQGVLFSYATARSYLTAHKVTQGLHARIPVIIYNGAFIRDHVSGEILLSSYFEDGAEALLKELLDADVYPLVYATFSGDSRASAEDGPGGRNHRVEDERGRAKKLSGEFRERFSYIPQRATEGMRRFLDTRKGDERERAVSTVEELMAGDIFYFTCIDEREKLAAICERYRERYHCVLSQEIYTKDWFLEIMPLATSKARAVMRLKEYLGCDRVVAFGDQNNDIDMFEVADEAYAVENAVEELKAVATGVIASNDDDGVAHFLRERLSELLRKV